MDPLTLVTAAAVALQTARGSIAASTIYPASNRTDGLVAVGESNDMAGGSWAAEIATASQRFGIPEPWICAVIRAESGGMARAVSRKGAIGLMQLMPETYEAMRARYGLGTDPFEPHNNIMAGTAYLSEMLDRYGAPGFLAAYNAGAARLDEMRAGLQPLPEETRRFLATVGPRTGMDETALAEFMVGDGRTITGAGGVFADATSTLLPNAASPSWRRLFLVLGSDHRGE